MVDKLKKQVSETEGEIETIKKNRNDIFDQITKTKAENEARQAEKWDDKSSLEDLKKALTT